MHWPNLSKVAPKCLMAVLCHSQVSIGLVPGADLTMGSDCAVNETRTKMGFQGSNVKHYYKKRVSPWKDAHGESTDNWLGNLCLCEELTGGASDTFVIAEVPKCEKKAAEFVKLPSWGCSGTLPPHSIYAGARGSSFHRRFNTVWFTLLFHVVCLIFALLIVCLWEAGDK